MPDFLIIPRGPARLAGAILLVVALAGDSPAEWGQDWGTMHWGVSTTSVSDGDRTVSGPMLYPNYPNPFNPRTVIQYAVPDPAPVTLRIYSAAGRVVRTLLNSVPQSAGHHEVVWDGNDDSGRASATGLYFCSMDAGQVRQSIRLVLVR